MCLLSSFSCVWLFATPRTVALQAPLSMGFSRQEYCHFLLQGIFPTQGSNPCLLHCRRILYQINHQGNPKESEVAQLFLTFCDPMDCSLPCSSVHGIFQARMLEWVVVSLSRGSSQPRDRNWVSPTAGRLFTLWAAREAQFRILTF